MKTIKSYTSLEQSKKLAEILPLESADMFYTLEDFVDEDTGDVFSVEKISFGHPSDKEIGCWSLAALLDVLPQGTRILKSLTNNTYHCDCPKENIDKWFDNPVDACYDMIIYLNELKML